MERDYFRDGVDSDDPFTAYHEPLGCDTHKQETSRNKFKLIRGAELLVPTPVKWLVKGIIEAGVLAGAFGAPASGKSFAAIDLAACIASGKVWHGHKVDSGAVVYIAGEGVAGLKRRLAAWVQANPDSKTAIADNFHLAERACTLPAEVADVIQAVKQVQNIKLVILDTLQRTMEGDENSTKDMSAYIKSLDDIKAALPDTSIMVVHHTGKGAQDQARGSSALRASLDAEIFISKDAGGVVTLQSSKAKDAEPFQSLSFKLESVVLDGWADDDGQPVTSAVLAYLADHKPAQDWRTKVKGAKQKDALIVLEELYIVQQRNLEESGYDPSGAQVTVDHWITDCVTQKISTKPYRFKMDILGPLLKKGIISTPNGGVYVQIGGDSSGENSGKEGEKREEKGEIG